MKRSSSLILAIGLAAGFALAQAQSGSPRPAMEDSAFGAADANRDGKVDREEYDGQDFQAMIYDAWFEEADSNKDGALDRGEYNIVQDLALDSAGVGA